MKKNLFSIFLCLTFSVSFLNAQAPPYNMTLAGQWNRPSLPVLANLRFNEVWGYAAPDGREYGIIGSLAYTWFIDVTDPANPVLVDSVAGGHPQCIHRDYKTYQHYVYAVADEGANSKLQVIDLSYLPDSVHVVFDSNQFFRRAHNTYIDTVAGRLYAVGSNTQNSGIITLDIATNPEIPTLISSVNLSHYTHDCFVKNDTLWANDGGAGMFMYDYSNPASPQLLGNLPTFPLSAYNHSSWLTEDGQYLVMAAETPNTDIMMTDITDPGNINIVSLFRSTLCAPADTQSMPHNPVVYGQYVAISYYEDGIVLFDISDPLNPVQAAWYDTWPNATYNGYNGCWGVYPFLPSGTILGSDVMTGLYVLKPGFPFPHPLAISHQEQGATCHGAADGAASVSFSGGSMPYSYLWSTGDTLPSINGLAAGTYYVTATDRNGFSINDTIVIGQPDSIAVDSITLIGESCPGSADGFIQIYSSGGTPLLSIVVDGTQPNPYSAAGGGMHTFVITDANNCSYTDSVNVPVLAQPPVAGFTFSSNGQFAYQFTDSSSGSTSWAWDFGDGGTSSLQNPSHVFTNGNWNVCLIISNSCGTDTFCTQITVNVEGIDPTPAFSFLEVYPNPASQSIFISLPIDEHGLLQVIDIQGKILSEAIVTGNSQAELQVADLAPGSYLLKFSGKNGIGVGRFMKE